jgi:phosphoglycerol geranylgeranyltransferase
MGSYFKIAYLAPLTERSIMQKAIRQILYQAKEAKKPLFAMLIDPDRPVDNHFTDRISDAQRLGADLFFVGGSLLAKDHLEDSIAAIREICDIPVILFPGSSLQVSDKADAILFLSLISGRNADMLIGQHVIAAPYIKQSKLEVLPTGYMLIDGGFPTTAHYISQTAPIPYNKPHIAVNTAIAGEMLGLSLIYLDAGSGADKPVSQDMIYAVRAAVNTPIIVGGGMRDADQVRDAIEAGADVVVVGNALESHPEKLGELIRAAKRSI